MARNGLEERSRRVSHWGFLALASALAFPGAAGCGGSSGSGRPNVVVIVLDTARPDFTSAYGHPRDTTPFLAAFAAQGTRYDRAYSTSSWTLPAHGSLFTGALPKVHRANQTAPSKVKESLPLLAEELAAAGYQTAAFSGNVWISPRSGLSGGFQKYRDLNRKIYRPWIQKLAADPAGRPIPSDNHYVVREVKRWLSSELDEDEPFFLFVNFVEPHLPYLPPWEDVQAFVPNQGARWERINRFYPNAEGSRLIKRHYASVNPGKSKVPKVTDAEWADVRAMYEGSLHTVDRMAQAIVESVDSVSPPENTIVFILSDHGEAFGEHGHFTHILNLYDTNLKIVCVARGPGFAAGAEENRLVQILDLYPTILKAAGVEPGPHAIGVDLRDDVPETRVLAASLEYPAISLRAFLQGEVASGRYDQYRCELYAAVSPRFKLIRRVPLDGGEGGEVEEELYDLLADPGEEQPLDPSDVAPEVLEALRHAVDFATIARAARSAEQHDFDEEMTDALEALGYFDGEGAEADDGE